eukprot:m.1428551 g.1428551  ORF g.1428551 m.1428551 type:complete len:1296 (-) comp25066_c0_seq72:228-4115(-)
MSSQSASHVLRRRLLAFVLGVSLFWKDAHATSICVGLCGVLLSPLSECFCDSSCVAAGTCCEGYTEACTTQPWMPGDLPFSDDYCLCEECCDHSSRNASQISVSNAGFKTTRIPLGQESSPLIPGWHRAPGTIGGTRRSLNGVAWVEEGTICQTTDEQLVDGGHYHMDSIVAAFDGEPFRALRFSLRAVPINAHSSVRNLPSAAVLATTAYTVRPEGLQHVGLDVVYHAAAEPAAVLQVCFSALDDTGEADEVGGASVGAVERVALAMDVQDCAALDAHCRMPMRDVVFLVDVSGSVDQVNAQFTALLQAIVELISMGPSHVRVGLATFSGGRASVLFDFNDNFVRTKADLQRIVRDLVFSLNDRTAIGRGLASLSDTLLKVSNAYGYDGRTADVIVLTDGRTSESTQQFFNRKQAIADTGVAVHAVACGSAIAADNASTIARLHDVALDSRTGRTGEVFLLQHCADDAHVVVDRLLCDPAATCSCDGHCNPATTATTTGTTSQTTTPTTTPTSTATTTQTTTGTTTPAPDACECSECCTEQTTDDIPVPLFDPGFRAVPQTPAAGDSALGWTPTDAQTRLELRNISVLGYTADPVLALARGSIAQDTSVRIGSDGRSVHSGSVLYTATVLVVGGVTHQYTDVTVALMAGTTVLAQSVLERNSDTRSGVLLHDLSVVYLAPPAIPTTAGPEELIRIVISVGRDVPEGRVAHIDSVRFSSSPVACVVPADEISPDLPFTDPVAVGGAPPPDCPLPSTDTVVLLDVSSDLFATRRAAAMLLVSRMSIGFNRVRVVVVAYADHAHVACTGGTVGSSAGYSNKRSLLECMGGMTAEAPTAVYQPSTTKALLWTTRNVIDTSFINTHVFVVASGSDTESDRLVESRMQKLRRFSTMTNASIHFLGHALETGDTDDALVRTLAEADPAARSHWSLLAGHVTSSPSSPLSFSDPVSAARVTNGMFQNLCTAPENDGPHNTCTCSVCRTCRDRADSCHACSAEDADDCRMCRNEAYLHQGVCLPTCPAGYLQRGLGFYSRRCEEITTTAPTPAPTGTPSVSPTPPTDTPTQAPTTPMPTASPSDMPSDAPSDAPSVSPSDAPSDTPSHVPSQTPSDTPTHAPTVPSSAPTAEPTPAPTVTPTHAPTVVSAAPTHAPSRTPTLQLSGTPTTVPTVSPSDAPTTEPTAAPSDAPTRVPSLAPTLSPSGSPSQSPSDTPTQTPSAAPSATPTRMPTRVPTSAPSGVPTERPTAVPSAQPTAAPTAGTVCVDLLAECSTFASLHCNPASSEYVFFSNFCRRSCGLCP